MKKIVLTRDGHLGKKGRKFIFPDDRADYLVRIGAAKYLMTITEIKEEQPDEPKQAIVKRPRKKKKK